MTTILSIAFAISALYVFNVGFGAFLGWANEDIKQGAKVGAVSATLFLVTAILIGAALAVDL